MRGGIKEEWLPCFSGQGQCSASSPTLCTETHPGPRRSLRRVVETVAIFFFKYSNRRHNFILGFFFAFYLESWSMQMQKKKKEADVGSQLKGQVIEKIKKITHFQKLLDK